jgi:CRP-like cAMP-binding protein
VNEVTYDFDHMIDDPFTLLPPSARRTEDMSEGDVLFRQDQSTSGLYLVVEGGVSLRRTSLGGDILNLHKAVSGGYFAEASIFSDRYHCDAICTESGTVMKISKTAVIDMMQLNRLFSEGLTGLLAVQVQQYRAQIEILAIRSAKERVLAAVQAGYLDAKVTDLASRINLTHEACYRALRALCDDKRMAQIGRGEYRLL